MSKPLMKCGHTAAAVDTSGNPVCPMCLGILPGADEVETNVPNLDGREAHCGSCGTATPSRLNLPFFEYHPNHDRDSYYCGCRGWD